MTVRRRAPLRRADRTVPLTTFRWVGLDGSQVLTHMTPVDTYTAQAGAGDVHNAVHRHKNLEQDDKGLLPFGNGDGGACVAAMTS